MPPQCIYWMGQGEIKDQLDAKGRKNPRKRIYHPVCEEQEIREMIPDAKFWIIMSENEHVFIWGRGGGGGASKINRNGATENTKTTQNG